MPELIPMGDTAWRLTLPEGADPVAALAALRALPGVMDAVVAEDVALVRFDPRSPPANLYRALDSLPEIAGESRRLHVIQVRYDGEDLAEVAELTGLEQSEIIRLHSEMEYRAELIGFLPGFAYLGPVAPLLAVPRRATPRPRVPANSVAIAAGRTAIYPFASPGGWRLIGTAQEFVGFDPQRGATIQLGDRVRCEPVR